MNTYNNYNSSWTSDTRENAEQRRIRKEAEAAKRRELEMASQRRKIALEEKQKYEMEQAAIRRKQAEEKVINKFGWNPNSRTAPGASSYNQTYRPEPQYNSYDNNGYYQQENITYNTNTSSYQNHYDNYNEQPVQNQTTTTYYDQYDTQASYQDTNYDYDYNQSTSSASQVPTYQQEYVAPAPVTVSRQVLSEPYQAPQPTNTMYREHYSTYDNYEYEQPINAQEPAYEQNSYDDAYDQQSYDQQPVYEQPSASRGSFATQPVYNSDMEVRSFKIRPCGHQGKTQYFIARDMHTNATAMKVAFYLDEANSTIEVQDSFGEELAVIKKIIMSLRPCFHVKQQGYMIGKCTERFKTNDIKKYNYQRGDGDELKMVGVFGSSWKITKNHRVVANITQDKDGFNVEIETTDPLDTNHIVMMVLIMIEERFMNKGKNNMTHTMAMRQDQTMLSKPRGREVY